MNLIDNLLQYLKSEQNPNLSGTPEGFCPNCWGRQEYGSKFYKAIKANDVNVNNIDSRVGWIQDYVHKNLKEITLQPKDHELVCSNCNITYKAI